MDKSDQTSTDGASKADTAASKRPQQKGNTPSVDSAKPSTALAKQEVKNIPRGRERDVPGRARAATAEAARGEAREAPYEKVRELPTAAVWHWGFQWDQHSWKTPPLLGTLLGAGEFHWETLLAEKDLTVAKASQIMPKFCIMEFLPVQILHFPVPLLILWSCLLQGEGGHW